MASVQPQGQRSPSSDLQPATAEHFRNELTACLVLTAPVGMAEESRREWLAVAWRTLRHLPADALSAGCKKARERCDHPSKIVPTIISETEQMMRWRTDSARARNVDGEHLLSKPEYVTPAEAAEIMREVGLKPGSPTP